MAIQDTIRDLREQRQTIDDALQLLEKISGSAPSTAFHRAAGTTPPRVRTGASSREVSDEVRQSRSDKMKKAWADRRKREADAAAGASSVASAASEPVVNQPPSVEDQLSAAAEPEIPLAPPVEPETVSTQITAAARRSRGGRSN